MVHFHLTNLDEKVKYSTNGRSDSKYIKHFKVLHSTQNKIHLNKIFSPFFQERLKVEQVRLKIVDLILTSYWSIIFGLSLYLDLFSSSGFSFQHPIAHAYSNWQRKNKIYALDVVFYDLNWVHLQKKITFLTEFEIETML